MVAGSGLTLGGLTVSQRHPVDPHLRSVLLSLGVRGPRRREHAESDWTEAATSTQMARRNTTLRLRRGFGN